MKKLENMLTLTLIIDRDQNTSSNENYIVSVKDGKDIDGYFFLEDVKSFISPATNYLRSGMFLISNSKIKSAYNPEVNVANLLMELLALNVKDHCEIECNFLGIGSEEYGLISSTFFNEFLSDAADELFYILFDRKIREFIKHEIFEQSRDLSYLINFYRGAILYVRGNLTEAKNAFLLSLEILENSQNNCLKEFLQLFYNRAFESTISKSISTELPKPIILLGELEDISTPDYSWAMLAIGSIILSNDNAVVINCEKVGNKELILDDIYENLENNGFIILIGHGNQENGFRLFSRIHFDYTDLEDILQNFENLTFMDFVCSNGHFNKE